MCLSGRLHGASEAYEKGLVDRLVPPDALLDRSLELAGEIGANPAPQLRMIKELLTRNGSATDLSDVQRSETALLRECWKTPEHREAVAAFVEKRPPRFR
jgi:2-(1,2-epoxy-1,2-dihydrophenyl)acetyl-CoA isomerase